MYDAEADYFDEFCDQDPYEDDGFFDDRSLGLEAEVEIQILLRESRPDGTNFTPQRSLQPEFMSDVMCGSGM